MAGKKQMSSVLLAVTMSAVIGICSAATFTVGDSTGWTIPTSSSFYPTWASNQKFQVGDTLVFKFPAGIHTVAEVSKSDYNSCTTGNPISAVLKTAPANITIGSAGTHYYICTITGHCQAGQMLAVTATTGGSPAPKPAKKASSPAKTPTATPTATASPTNTATTPSAAPSAVPAAGPSGVPVGTTSTGPAAAPPSGNFAASNAAGVGLVGLISAAVAAFFI